MLIPQDLLEGSAAEALGLRLRAITPADIFAPCSLGSHDGLFVGFADNGLKCLWVCMLGFRADHQAILDELLRVQENLLQTEPRSTAAHVEVQAYVTRLGLALGRARDLAGLARNLFEVEVAAQFPKLYNCTDPVLDVDSDWTIYAFQNEDDENELEERLLDAFLDEEHEADKPSTAPPGGWLH